MRSLGLLLASSLLVAASGCAAVLREPVAEPWPGQRRDPPWDLNPELLTRSTERILFVVDRAEGHAPERDALDGLVQLAARYGERPASWIPAGAPGAPALRFRRGRLRGHGPFDPATTYVFIGYVGWQLDAWGRADEQLVGGQKIYLILINQERHRRWRGFIPERHLEQQTLVHEYGHLLGLPTPEHAYHPGGVEEGAHCVNPDCALSKPRLRAMVYGLFHVAIRREYLEDYCEECRAAIGAAKRRWGDIAGPHTGPDRDPPGDRRSIGFAGPHVGGGRGTLNARRAEGS